MGVPILGDLIREAGETLREVIKDPDKQAELDVQLQDLADRANQREQELMLAQVEVNKIEAANPNIFAAGWRPAIGWVGAISLATYYIPYSLTATFIWAYQSLEQGKLLDKPDMGITDLIGLLGSLLGVSILRTVDKKISTAVPYK